MKFLDRYCTGGSSVPACPTPLNKTHLILDVGAADIATKKGQASCSWQPKTGVREPNTNGLAWIGSAAGCGRFGLQRSEASKQPARSFRLVVGCFTTGSRGFRPRASRVWSMVPADRIDSKAKFLPGSTRSSSRYR